MVAIWIGYNSTYPGTYTSYMLPVLNNYTCKALGLGDSARMQLVWRRVTYNSNSSQMAIHAPGFSFEGGNDNATAIPTHVYGRV